MNDKLVNTLLVLVSVIVVGGAVYYSRFMQDAEEPEEENRETYATIYTVNNGDNFLAHEVMDSTYVFADSVIVLEEGCCYVENLSDSDVVLYPYVYQGQGVSDVLVEDMSRAAGGSDLVDNSKGCYPEYFSPSTFAKARKAPDYLQEVPGSIEGGGPLRTVKWCLMYVYDSPAGK